MEKNGAKLLIIDDDNDVRQSTEFLLKSKGFANIDSANGAEEGMRKLSAGKYDMVLLDMIMPKTSGWGVLELMAQKKIKTRVLVLSAVGLPEVVGAEISKKYPDVQFLPKTHATTDLADKVVEMLKLPAKPL